MANQNQHIETEGECEPDAQLDFTTETFVNRREPIRELISTFSELYIDSEDDEERVVEAVDEFSSPFPPPPPLEMEEGNEFNSLSSVLDSLVQLEERFTNMEQRMEECNKRVGEGFSQAEMESKCKKLEDQLSYRMERECSRIQQKLELCIQDLGRSMVDCLKRRDTQIDNKLKSLIPLRSTPIRPTHSSILPPSVSQVNNQTYQVPPSHTQMSISGIPSAVPPVKIEFPNFNSSEDDDPVAFIERCEEYLAIRPLSDYEILASLTSVLKNTTKDWWVAEKRNVQTWEQFKKVFLRSFLNEDYEDETARRLLERKQGAQEGIRDFAFHYRALCLKWKKDMSEKEILQSILRNCNPRLASLLRGTVRDVGELVRIGTQIEKDLEESKKYWNNVNSEAQRKKSQLNRETVPKLPHANTRVMQSTQSTPRQDPNMITLPILLRNRYLQAVIDTGSTLSLIQESCWKQLKNHEVWKSSNGQTFLLANGQSQTALGKSDWECELQGKTFKLTLYVMRDSDLTVPVILGMDFLMTSGIILDFKNLQYNFPSKDDGTVQRFPLWSHESSKSLLHFYLALPTPQMTVETLQSIDQLVLKSDSSEQFKNQLESLMRNWPTVCTHEIGHSKLVKHRIITTDEVPVRKRAYRVSVPRQQFIDSEIQELLSKNIIRPSVSPWASPVVIVPKKGGDLRLCVDYRGLNTKTHLDGYPMPQIQEILESLHGASIFSTLDLKSGYWQLEMDPDSIHKTAFVTTTGQFEFLRLPFGLKNSAASFQRLMENVLKDIRAKCCFVYIDDIVVYSENEQEHLQHLDQVFNCLQQAGLTLNLKKCNLVQQSLTFLGHVVSSEGIKTDPSKVEAICDFPVPQSLKDLQRFLGLAGWYHRFIPNLSGKAAPLHSLKKKQAIWTWTEACQQSFEIIKQDLSRAPVLIPP